MSAAARLALAVVLAALPPAQEAPPGYARLAELAELGLDAELVRVGLPEVRAGGALAADGDAVALVARALFAVGREADAFALLDAAETAGASGDAALVLMRARLLLQTDDLKGALTLLAAAPSTPSTPRFPDLPDNQLLLARALVRAERHDLAEPLLDRFVQAAPLHPEGPAAWHMLFDCAVRRDDLERARACLDEKERRARWHDLMKARRLQVRRDPEARLPRLGLALLWLEVERLDDARRALDELIARHPDDAEAWLHLGEVHRRAGRQGDAARAWERALEIDPAEHRARFNLAAAYRVAGRADDARRELERLLGGEARDDPRFLAAHLELARLLRAAGLAEEAAARYAEYRARGGEEPFK